MEAAMDQHESVVPEEEDVAALPFLPDDVHVMVFAYLSVSELLRARLVCRRWSELALHQDVWRHRDFAANKQGVLDLVAALRLAPCVRTLDLHRWFSLMRRDERLRIGALAATTRCAAKHVVVEVVRDHDADVSVVSILRNQVSLGRLRELKMDVFISRGQQARVDLILAGCAAEGLTRLELSIDAPEGSYRSGSDCVPVARPKPSLKRLAFAVTDPTWWPLALHLLDGHAATLESLSLRGLPDGPLGSGRPWAESAARVAGLRELDCPLMPGMNAFLQCDKLEALVLTIEDGVAAAANLREAAAFLRGRSAQLQKLTIETGAWTEMSLFDQFDKSLAAVAMGLLEALASSSRSTLKVLRLDVRWDSRWASAVLARLTAALEHLPDLSEVRVLVQDGDAVLPLAAGVGRATSGGARPLTLRLDVRSVGDPCLHAWMHANAHRIAKLFEECPSFHVELDDGQSRGSSCGKSDCFACKSGCHGSSSWKEKKRMVLFGHSWDEPCDSPEHADADVTCYRLGYQLYSCTASKAF